MLSTESEHSNAIIGKHVYANLYGIDKSIANDPDYLKKIVVDAVRKANATLVDLRAWRFGGAKGGVSVIALVLESHIALHTWPYYEYATLDIYTCGENTDPWKAFNYIVSKIKPKHYKVHYADRSSIESLNVSPQVQQ